MDSKETRRGGIKLEVYKLSERTNNLRLLSIDNDIPGHSAALQPSLLWSMPYSACKQKERTVHYL